MFKAELKEKWGHYCDTDKLVDDMMALLTKYRHRNTEYGVCAVLDKYFENKSKLIDMFASSPNYIGDMRIMLDAEIMRTIDADGLYYFCREFPNAVEARNVILKYVDEDGKSLDDYSRVGHTKLRARQMLDNAIRNQLKSVKEGASRFNDDGTTRESQGNYEVFSYLIRDKFAYNDSATLRQNVVDIIQHYKINGSFVEGMKTSRAFNRICATYGVDKLPEYNRIFAKYADMVSDLKRKFKFYISLNPLDYLTMSFGVSWASCHTIDKQNARNMPSSYSGMYCGGTMSYMLDGSSFITYVHDKATTDVEEGKIYRNMFHYQDDVLIQGRIYPQGNDGQTDLYSEFRSIVQDELAGLLGLSDNTWIKRNKPCEYNTASRGVHYKDYANFSQCNVTYPKERSLSFENTVHIGHDRICPYCGKVITGGDVDAATLGHYDCVCMDEITGEILAV